MLLQPIRFRLPFSWHWGRLACFRTSRPVDRRDRVSFLEQTAGLHVSEHCCSGSCKDAYDDGNARRACRGADDIDNPRL